MVNQPLSPIVNTAIIQFRPDKGDYKATLGKLGRIFDQVSELPVRPQVITLPESALTGYFLEGGVRDCARTAEELAQDLKDIYAASKLSSDSLDIVLGFYELFENSYYNSAMYLSLDRSEHEIVHIHRKLFLPTYGVFDEARFVEPGTSVQAFDTRWGRAAILVCEDAWHGLTANIVALDGAQVVFIPSASPARGNSATDHSAANESTSETDTLSSAPDSVHKWERIAKLRAEENGIYVLVTHLAGTEGGKVFSGGSLVIGPSGDLRARAPLWDEGIISASLDINDITRARSATPLLADLRTSVPHLVTSLTRAIK